MINLITITQDTLVAEPFSLPMIRYRANGEPTCATNWETSEFCHFLRVQGMCGKIEVCGITGDALCRGGDGHGFLKPCKSCPVWHAPDGEGGFK